MKDVFISHSTENAKIAHDLCDAIEKEGLSCWIAPRDIEVGKDYGSEIIKGIEECKIFLLCLSHASNESQHVLREVERAVNHKNVIVVYQYEEVELSKSLENFLASTQWFIPKSKTDINELVDIIKKLKEKEDDKAEEKEGPKRKKTWIYGVVAAAVAVLLIALALFLLKPKQEPIQVAVGDTFTFGSVDLSGAGAEPLDWIVLDVNEETDTALCIAEKIVAFQPYDGAESGWRGRIGDLFCYESDLEEYSDEQLVQFWGSSDWETSNIRSWLNSGDAIVSYEGMAPILDSTTLYENNYETRTGFLYTFTEEEQNALVPTTIITESESGQMKETEDKVFLLSKEEAEKYLVDQNIVLAAVPTESAALLEGTGIYQYYCEEGSITTFWGLRSYGEIGACTILCAGTGMGKTESFHSEYACASLMGVRPAIVLPLEDVAAFTENLQ